MTPRRCGGTEARPAFTYDAEGIPKAVPATPAVSGCGAEVATRMIPMTALEPGTDRRMFEKYAAVVFCPHCDTGSVPFDKLAS